MSKKKSDTIAPAIGFVIVAAFALAYFCFYTVPEGKQGIVFQFGRIIPPAKTEAGLYFKVPWRNVELFEKRILNWDGRPEEINTLEKNNIIVDTTARYQIIDPIMFRRVLVNTYAADDRIGKLIKGATNNVVADHDLVETVRNTNDILQRTPRSQKAQKALPVDKATKTDDDISPEEATKILKSLVAEEISGELEEIKVGREKLTAKIIALTLPEMEKFGLALIDIQLKSVALEESVERNVYERMITERERIVAKIRSVGLGEKAKIQGKTNRELQKIQSGAYRTVQGLKGSAEGDAIRIYATAVKKAPSFYEFVRTIEAYQKGLREDSQLILSADAQFLKFLREGPLEE